jgi:prevent-host-death family protein
MVAYSRDEIVAASEASKRLGALLQRLKKTRRLVLSRNNHLEAVLLPIEEYEELMEDLDHLLLACEIAERKARDTGKRIPWEKLKANYGL